MALTWFSVVVDCEDPRLLADFWCQVLGYRIVFEAHDFVSIAGDDTTFPGIEFVLDETHVGGGRARCTSTSTPTTRTRRSTRLLSLGARRVDVGQAADASWVVLADPEDNAFCVLTPQSSWLDDRGLTGPGPASQKRQHVSRRRGRR